MVARMRSILGAFSLGDDPSSGQIINYLNGTVPIDLAGLLPLSAHYDARIEFTLEEQSDGAFTLKQGTVNWTVSNSAEISGEGTSITDEFSGAGSAALDPATDVIRLEFDFSQR